MKGNKHMKTITNIIYPALAVFAFTCFAVLPGAQAVSPAPDGCYPGFTTAEGCNALAFLTTGAANTGVGWYSLFSDTTANYNTGVGAGTLLLNTADSNTAVGAAALLLNTSGTLNTAVGTDTLVYNDTGGGNTANGAFALLDNTTGNDNTALGFAALESNSTSSANTAVGSEALAFNTGADNTATGFQALLSNTTGGFNTASGVNALTNNTTGGSNTANGVDALHFNTTGNLNSSYGGAALQFDSGNGNTAMGFNALGHNTVGSENVALGDSAGVNATTGSHNVYIGAGMGGVAGESDACYIASIFGQTSANGVAILINASNKLGTMTSSKRFKKDIKPMDQVSEKLYALSPVSFHYKKEIDPAGTSQLGLVAEDVEKVNPDLVVRDKEGKPYSVRYDQVNAMLLNEFLKEHRKVQEQDAIIAREQQQIDALTAGLQKVSAQLELSKSVPQTVLNDR